MVQLATQSMIDATRLRSVHKLLDEMPLLDNELMDTLEWSVHYWQGVPGDVYVNALPLALREMRSLASLRADPHEECWALTRAGQTALASPRRRGSSHQLLSLLATMPRSTLVLNASMPKWRPTARRLMAAGLIERNVSAPVETPPSQDAPRLSDEQSVAIGAITTALDGFQAFLLHGITGSGKTEVYLAVITEVLARGQQALLLVPEIGLVPQTIDRLQARLGVPVEVMHSNLSAGARARAWLRARRGTAKIILGTRLAIFSPLPKAGVLIVDEEHDVAYKQQEGFRYHARDLAVVRARALGVPVILGSGTPSLESLANVDAKRYRVLRLRARPGALHDPQVRVIDLRGQHVEHGLSAVLLQAIEDTLARGEQALIFKNRRGYAPVLLCHDCGWHAACVRCDCPMTLHAARRQLICHHCDQQMTLPSCCPSCGASQLTPLGQGTERLEQALVARFPSVPVLRIDRDTTQSRTHFEQIMRDLRHDKKGAILVGTQMLTKGHDLPRLTLVAIVGMDESLFSVDFRAGEHLAQTLIQVAGRAGRAASPGQVLLQTHHPEHPLLRQLLKQGYAEVAAGMLTERKLARLPPFSQQALLRAEASQYAVVEAFLGAAQQALPSGHALQIAGPMAAPMPRRAGLHRGQLLLESERRGHLHEVLGTWYLALFALPEARRVRWSLDVNPVELY